MQSKRIAISTELHQKLIDALAACLGIRQNLAEKSIDTFLSDVLDRLADDPSLLKSLLSSGARENGAGLAQSSPEDR